MEMWIFIIFSCINSLSIIYSFDILLHNPLFYIAIILYRLFVLIITHINNSIVFISSLNLALSFSILIIIPILLIAHILSSFLKIMDL
jgi:uncharacterized membrane protein